MTGVERPDCLFVWEGSGIRWTAGVLAGLDRSRPDCFFRGRDRDRVRAAALRPYRGVWWQGWGLTACVLRCF